MNLLGPSTTKHTKYWQNRKIDWEQAYLSTWNHPHRQLILKKLSEFAWGSLLEIGCASGPNLYLIKQVFKNKDVGGIDVNSEAIETARKHLGERAWLDVSTGEDIMMSDDSTDVVLTDMALIYVGPNKIKNYLREIRRICRKTGRLILVEFHHKSWWQRFLLKIRAGYYAYDYRKLLESEGFGDISIEKIPLEAWPGGDPQKTFGYIITAKP